MSRASGVNPETLDHHSDGRTGRYVDRTVVDLDLHEPVGDTYGQDFLLLHRDGSAEHRALTERRLTAVDRDRLGPS
jgi:hypothetical protein